MDDRRKFQRFSELAVDIRLCASGEGSCFEADLKDVSIGGLKIRTDEPVEMYGFYSVEISFGLNGDRETVRAEGKVWRIEPDTEKNDDKSRFAAIEFTSFAEGNRALFTKFIAGFILMGETGN